MPQFAAIWRGQETRFEVDRLDSGHLKVVWDGQERVLDVVRVGQGHYSVLVDGASYVLSFHREGDAWQAFINGEECSFLLKDERAMRREQVGGGFAVGDGRVVCPMPGKVISVSVSVGDKVNAGDAVAVVEAMKMQNEFKAPVAGVVKEVCVAAGDSVEGGAVLVVIGESW